MHLVQSIAPHNFQRAKPETLTVGGIDQKRKYLIFECTI